MTAEPPGDVVDRPLSGGDVLTQPAVAVALVCTYGLFSHGGFYAGERTALCVLAGLAGAVHAWRARRRSRVASAPATVVVGVVILLAAWHGVVASAVGARTSRQR